MTMPVSEKALKARKYCIRLLAVRNRTEEEVIEKLKAKGYGEVAEEVVSRLKAESLIDDLKFALEWIEYRMSASPRGRKALEKELYGKRVPEAVIDQAIEKAKIPDDTIIAESLAYERARTASGSDPEKRKAAVYRFLASRGIDPDTAEEAVNKVMEG
ncbi:MAG: hypothetical protein GF408_00395 [Candidatus Omnitrophica bacterium]|nr:hypothetical protein [Candidatus Omnitrophota bacterium]